MMEISLNLLWLGIALVFTGIWIFRWRRASRICALSGAIALGCALILLFPSVSLTDDLHPQIVAFDAAAGKRTISQLMSTAGGRVSHGSAAGLNLPAHAIVGTLPNVLTLGLIVTGSVVAEKASARSDADHSSYSGRSPPPFVHFC
jgi:hypothetical protein